MTMKNILVSVIFLITLSVKSQTAYFPFQNSDEKWGIININLETVYKPVFENEISFFINHDGKFPVAPYRLQNRKYGLLNHLGKQLLEPLYDRVNSTDNEKIIILRIGNKKSLYNIEIEKIIIENINLYSTKIEVSDNSIHVIEENKKVSTKYDLTGQIEWKKAYPEEEIILESIEEGDSDNDSPEPKSKESTESDTEPKSLSSSEIDSRQKILDKLGFKYNGLDYLDKDHIIVNKFVNDTSTAVVYGLYSLLEKRLTFKTEFDIIKRAYTNSKKTEYAFISKNGVSGYANIYNGKLFIPLEK